MLTKHPGGLSLRGLPIFGPLFTTGRVFFVSSVTGRDASDWGVAQFRPFATIHYALNYVVSGRGDVIILLPGHVQTITGANPIEIAKAGLTILGVGYGAQRPKFYFSEYLSWLRMGASCVIDGVHFITGPAENPLAGWRIAIPIRIQADDCTLRNCLFSSNEATEVAIRLNTVSRTLLDNITFDNSCYFQYGIDLIAATNTEIRNCNLRATYVYAIHIVSATNYNIHNTVINMAIGSGTAIALKDDSGGAATGKFGPNIYIRIPTDGANITEAVEIPTAHGFQPIYICNADGEVAMLTNITASTDA